MQKITPAHKTYRQVEDVREEPIKYGKYLYLFILGAFLLTIVHILFGHMYMLKGEGYVFADNRAVELEYDATILNLTVNEGDTIEPNTNLFNYDSLSFRDKLSTLAFNISELKNELGEMQLEWIEMNNQLGSAKKYSKWSESLRSDLNKLSQKNLVARTQLSTESYRSFEAKERLESYEAKKKQVELNIQTLQKNIAEMEKNYQEMISRYNNGTVKAEVTGIVNGLQVTKGDVLKKGENAMRIFYGKPYIYAYFDQSSWVHYHPGDTVFVHIPSKGYVKGKITKLMPVTHRVPEEFQPRFKRTQRQQLAEIEVDQKVLRNTAMMSTVRIFKPFFM